MISEEELKNMSEKEKKEKIKELEKAIDIKIRNYNTEKAMQSAIKMIINGTYGALAHPKFVLSNKNVANAITIHGRDVILYMLDNIEKYFYNKWHLDKDIHKLLTETYIGVDNEQNAYMLNYKDEIVFYPEKYSDEFEDKTKEEKEKSAIFNLLKSWNIKPEKLEEIENKKINVDGKEIIVKFKRHVHDFSNVRAIDGTVTGDREKMDSHDTKFHKEEMVIYGDTDSVFGSTAVFADGEKIKIEDFYNKNKKNGSAGKTLKGHESVKTNQKVLNWDENKGLYYANVKRIIRHKVRKAKWKLKTKNGKEIIVTNDHSMIVFRNGTKMEVKPSEILNSDKILTVIRKQN
jgi:DNA polymerase elongation subunit (family B)